MLAKILVVDDETDLEILISQKFRREIRNKEIAFEFAHNGKEALDKLEELPDIDVVLTDINMPEMDGLSFLQNLKARDKMMQAIVVSAYGDLENIRAAMNRGAYDFLTKPIDFDDLKITLRKTLEHVRELREAERAQEEKRQAQEDALAQELKAKEAQRKLIEHLRRLDKLKDDFLANTSHELRTPLNGIIGIVESLLDGAGGDVNDKVRQNLAMVVASGKRLASLVDDILDFSKMKTGEVHLKREPVDLHAAVEDVFQLSAPLMIGKELTLENQLPEDLPAVDADPNRLAQILHNLIGNALKFTERGSITVSAHRADDRVTVEVRDTGVGIPTEKFEDIFKMFEQVEVSATRSHGGTGLGLAITRNLVELHGGHIQVESELGQGSVFRFTLQVSEDAPTVKTERVIQITQPPLSNESLEFANLAHQAFSRGEYRVLVVDDEPVNQQVLANHLSLRDFLVVQAMNGIEALKRVEDGERFDLVILDIMMPGMSGYEVAQRIRDVYSLVELPILMLTAKNQSKDFVQGLECGANDYITKPFDKRELLARVDTLLALKAAVGELQTHQAELLALTERAEEMTRAEEEARQSDQQKSDFLAIMSHELRTPLNAIIGYSEILHEDLESEDQSPFVPDVLKIQSSAKQLLSLINNVLDLTKIERGKMELYLEQYKLSSLVEEVAITLKPLVGKNGNHLTLEVEEGIGLVKGDVTKTRQILLNLLSNACKFTRRGKIVLRVSLGDDSETLCFQIRDTGIGMTREQLARLFKPFSQGDASTSKHYGGSGLGLVITKRIAEMMGGQVSVASELGEGSTFTVNLPREVHIAAREF
ncbi:Response regulator [Sulfidibacter corallicola]|uniref:histidine kinase n=1 Tax=Sulfidibacter corallicola TaxID=2818388 RepID=A0A8A4THU9_SULCO|nr:ATP-binding protein [Sulfidibacter corallicola]QTD49077.1 response regulator [Sulfidibacter corallicola]